MFIKPFSFEWIAYGLLALIAVSLLIIGRNKLQDLVDQQKNKRSKRNEYEGVLATDDDGEDVERQPLELQAINRKERSKMSHFDEEDEQQLTLFDQDDTNPQQ